MRRPGFEPGFWAWKAQVIATRPSTHKATHLEVFVTYNVFAPEFRHPSFVTRVSLREHEVLFARCARSRGLTYDIYPLSVSNDCFLSVSTIAMSNCFCQSMYSMVIEE
jgi:hypothetical protein